MKRPLDKSQETLDLGRQLLRHLTILVFLAPSKISAGSVCNPGTVAAEVEDYKSDEHKDLINNGIFSPH